MTPSKLRFFSSALDGQTFTLTASQGGPVASQILTNWGEAETGGPISIVVDRTNLQVVPDRVRFTVDLSESSFSTTDTYDPVNDQTFSNGYNPAAHDLIFLWDTGDDGTWEYPTHNPSTWRQKREAKGPVIQHVYDTPGNHTVGLTVIEPSTGKISTAETVISVSHPDSTFPNTQTICVNPIGDTNFAGAPSNALLVNADQLTTSDTLWTNTFGKPRVRWLFKSGGSFDVALRFANNQQSGMYFGAYGGSQKPTLNFVQGEHMFWLDLFGSGGREFRFTGLRMQGSFDPTIQTGSAFSQGGNYQNGWFGTWATGLDLTVHDMEIFGCVGTIAYFSHLQANNTFRYAFDSILASDNGGEYNFFPDDTENPNSAFSLTGSRIVQNPNSIADDGLVRAIARVKAAGHTYIARNDLFCLSENNPAFRLCDGYAGTPPANNVGSQLVNVTENAVECNTGFAGLAFNDAGWGPSVHNVILDSNIICGAWNTNYFIRSVCCGVTMRNNVVWQPNIADQYNGGLFSWFYFFLNENTASGLPIPNAPVRVFNNTFVNERDSAKNNNRTSPIFGDKNGQFLAAGITTEANNLVHQPNLNVPQVEFAPLASDTLFVPRSNVGRITEASLTPDTSRATQGNMSTFIPLPGSTALGSAELDPISYFDLFRTLRPAYPSVGAWENDSA